MPGHLHHGDGHSTGHAQLGRVLEKGAAPGGCCWPGHRPIPVVSGIYNCGIVSFCIFRCKCYCW